MSSVTESDVNNENSNEALANNSGNPFSLFLNIWTSPTSAYQQLQHKTWAWLPLLAIVLLQIVVVIYYSYSVDFAWMFEQTMAASGRELSPEQQDAMANMQGRMGPMMSAIFGSIGIAIMFPLIFAISAGYYTIISSFTADGNKFGQWFGFVAWSSTPMMFVALASMVSILLNDNGQILQNDLNPLSLNSLVFNYRLGEPGFTFLSSIDLSMVWITALNIIGYKVWTKKSTPSSVIIVCAPMVILFGLFAYFSFR